MSVETRAELQLKLVPLRGTVWRMGRTITKGGKRTDLPREF
jgi:hypothetical protein